MYDEKDVITCALYNEHTENTYNLTDRETWSHVTEVVVKSKLPSVYDVQNGLLSRTSRYFISPSH